MYCGCAVVVSYCDLSHHQNGVGHVTNALITTSLNQATSSLPIASYTFFFIRTTIFGTAGFVLKFLAIFRLKSSSLVVKFFNDILRKNSYERKIYYICKIDNMAEVLKTILRDLIS